MKILNLGCGSKVSSNAAVINMDWSILLRVKKNFILSLFAPLLFRGERWNRFQTLPQNIVVHNLARGLPFEDNSIDAIYHSHLLEHLDRDIARVLLIEIYRVLKPGGVVRVVVPNFEADCRAYLESIARCERDETYVDKHDAYIALLIEQSVRREASGSRKQNAIRRRIENLLLGDARKRGETHQWAYDKINLTVLLKRVGFRSPEVMNYETSSIPNWNNYRLDLDADGNEYKPGSLYIEACK